MGAKERERDFVSDGRAFHTHSCVDRTVLRMVDELRCIVYAKPARNVFASIGVIESESEKKLTPIHVNFISVSHRFSLCSLTSGRTGVLGNI